MWEEGLHIYGTPEVPNNFSYSKWGISISFITFGVLLLGNRMSQWADYILYHTNSVVI